jgi:hypothetical protein
LSSFALEHLNSLINRRCPSNGKNSKTQKFRIVIHEAIDADGDEHPTMNSFLVAAALN